MPDKRRCKFCGREHDIEEDMFTGFISYVPCGCTGAVRQSSFERELRKEDLRHKKAIEKLTDDYYHIRKEENNV